MEVTGRILTMQGVLGPMKCLEHPERGMPSEDLPKTNNDKRLQAKLFVLIHSPWQIPGPIDGGTAHCIGCISSLLVSLFRVWALATVVCLLVPAQPTVVPGI